MAEVLESLKLTGGGSATGTRELDALRASASFTPQPTPMPSGSIPAGSTSIAPHVEAPSAGKKWLPLVVGGLALAAAAAVFLGRPRAPAPVTTSASESKPPEPPAAKPQPSTPSAPVVIEPPPSTAQAELPTVALDTEPSGARVRDEQKSLVCDKTPCKLAVPAAGMTVVIESNGYSDQKVKLAPNDPPRLVKLSKVVVPARPAAPKPTAAAPAAPPPAPGGYHNDPY
jgi:hypothetical protein